MAVKHGSGSIASIEEQVDDLTRMTVPKLRERYREVFGEDTTSGNRQWLLRRVAWRIQAIAEGDLSERAKARAAELARDADLRLRPPPGPMSARAPLTLAGRPHRPCSPSVGGNLVTVTGRVVRSADDRLPAPGTILRREHKGVEHVVTVLASGFEHEGKTYRSLSAVAAAITGSKWNGFLFFGLTKEPA
jgi:hypothetical protein